MSSARGDDQRRLLPRWRAHKDGLAVGEFGGTGKSAQIATEEAVGLQEKLASWQENGSIADAVDVVAAAMLSNSFDKAQQALEKLRNVAGKHAAVAVLADAATVDVPWRRGLAISDSIPSFGNKPYENINRLRKNLIEYPRNAFLWNALSRAYVSLGNSDRSVRSMEVALALAPQSRYIVRAATRLFIHLKKIGRAHDLLLKFPGMTADPWILSAELAVSDIKGVSSKFAKHARSVAADEQFSAGNRSELNSSIATLEFQSGDIKSARKHFKASLERPTENSVAQAIWASSADRTLMIYGGDFNIPYSFEAQALKAKTESKWNDSIKQSWLWMDDEPFSKRPAIEGSYIASVAMGDYEQSVEFARVGLKANPSSVILRNNLVASLALMGNFEEAAREFLSIEKEDGELPRSTVLATAGLIRFRTGEPQLGRENYEQAIQLAKASADFRSAAIAALHLANEHRLSVGVFYEKDVKRALELSQKSAAPEVKAMYERVLGKALGK